MATPQRLETVRRIQQAMALSYSGLAAWCLFHPSSVIRLGLTPAYAIQSNATTELFCRCFGAQAMTCGLLLGTAPMSARSFTAFGLAMTPYIVFFNFWGIFGSGKAMLTKWIWLDFVGNVFFGLGSLYCAKVLREHEKEESASKSK